MKKPNKNINKTKINICMPYFVNGFFLSLILFNKLSLADDMSKKEALKEIRETAVVICNQVSDTTKTEKIELSGEAKAKLNGLISKVVDLGVEGAGKYTSEQSKGVLQADIAKLMENAENCKLKVFEDLKDKLLSSLEYPIIIAEGDYLYDFSDFGRVDGENSSVQITIDNKSLTTHRVNLPFGSHQVYLTEGAHNVNYIAQIRGKGSNAPEINTNCMDTFIVNRPEKFEPRLKFESLGTQGKIKCSLIPGSFNVNSIQEGYYS